MKKAFLLIFLLLTTYVCFDALAQSWSFDCDGDNCLKAGVEAAGESLGQSTGVITSKGIVQAVQDLIIYFLSFLSLIAVIYIMWAGAQMLLFPSSEESSEKTKKIIVSVIAGIAIIWFAWWMVSTIFYLLNNNQVVSSTWVPRAVAETQIRNVDFTTYSNKIRALKTRITGGYSPEITSELNVLVDGAFDHLPDRADKYVNKQLYDKVKRAIADYDLHREEIDRGILENAIDDFLEQVQVFSIQGTLSATPRSGDAPLSVTLEGKNIIDKSGTIIPEGNFTWWLRTPDGPRVLGRGKTINYIFQDEGTYTVYLTVNSASKNNRGFVDVISFEDQTTVEVGQAKLKLVVYFNDQLATESVKIPSRESTQKVLIDATQTRFASGYTITKTEWDFGNGKTVIREGAPIIEAQNYKEGEFTVKMTLTRNDGESFTRSILLKVGDPIASISVNNANPNKGDNVIFQAKKVVQEGVQYSWEIRKFGIEKPIFTGTGPRIEYTFREVGRYSVGLTSAKGDARDKETVEIDIESRPPVVRFNADQLSPETPNIYVFDGTSTYDPDYPDDQSLKYQWFVNDKPAQLTSTNSNNSRGEYAFPEIGAYQVELHVTDDQGKTATFKKDITIKSLLSIQINIRPQVVKRGDKIIFTATAPNADIYEWNLGSKDIAVTQTGRYVNSFDVSGTYPLVLKVTDKYGNTNTIQRKIYVIDGDKPLSVIQMSTKSLLAEVQENACNGQSALIADRVNPVSFVGDKSVNVGGKTADLTYFWKVGLNATSVQKNFSHTFDELGCEAISLTVVDKKTGVSSTTQEWVKVVNVPPQFSDIEVKVENIDKDPMLVNLRMEGAKDPDGVIRSYTWYYYTSTDEEPQGFRITTTPETSFPLSKINGRYYFSVVMEDSNGLRVDTREMSESRYSTPDLLVNQNIATPIIEFRASTLDAKYGDPVELSVTVKNALGQDITKAAEYRWDVDGDGFYDIKTSENVLTYKYTLPGEYHPKVKVTHRGLSTTKFLTITVTNRLIPQAQIQVIGDKIIAYNTSSGIVQSVTWFADDVKVSENKEYLVYTPSGESFPKNIRLEISDGDDKQSVTIPLERNPQNKILIRKVSRPLVILSNENTTVTPAPDDIVWADPTKPLFFYLGESEGEIQYYVIDNDVDIDTDLSGGKNDDADNKGTASYRLGRPYQVPVGTKRITIMRFRILGADGKELDSRQIRVTRTFMAAEVDAEINHTAPAKTTQTFNMTKEDKARLDRLSVLVKSIPDEGTKNELMRYVDQLGDIWYDRADRADTLVQFSHAVDGNSTIDPDLKSRILEQVSIIYTQGDQDVAERDLALTILRDLLAKSTYQKEIFGDGTDENPGLLDGLIDNPEYYSQNKKIVDRIYNEYVKLDTTLSDDAKATIQEKLTLLAGTPPVVKPGTGGETPVIDDNASTGFLATLKDKLGSIGPLVLWICLAIIGVFGIIFAISKIRSSGQRGVSMPHDDSLSPIDNSAEEPHGPNWLHEEHADIANTPLEENHAEGTPDWLKAADSPFGSEDVLATKEVASGPVTPPSTTTPDWMHDDHGTHVPETLQSVTASATNTPETTTTPDWLADTSSAMEHKEVAATEVVQKSEAQAPTHDDIPDWLRGAETLPETSPLETPDTPKKVVSEENTLFAKETGAESTPETIIPPETEENTVTPAEKATPELDHELPDWLKGSETMPEVPEDNTPVGSNGNTPAGADNSTAETVSPSLGNTVPLSSATPMDAQKNTPEKKKKRGENKHWKKPKTASKAKKSPSTKKLIEESVHLLGPAEDLLTSPEHLIAPDDTSPPKS